MSKFWLTVRATAAAVLLAGSFAALASPGGSGVQPKAGAVDAGRSLYTHYCRSCHGPAGLGDGLIRDYLRHPPPNLTTLARGNAGVFPSERVRRIIDGREPIRAHQDSQMPIWGEAFAAEPDRAKKLDDLVAFLESIQTKPSP